MLALMGDAAGHPPPEGLQNCPFFVEEALPPIVCYPLSDVEQRLQQNINSSKAMSSLSHAERASVATGAAYGGGTTAEGGPGGHKGGPAGWTPVKQWNRNNASTGVPVKGGGSSRPYVPPGRNGPRGDSANISQEPPQLTPFGQRFANRGRGAQSTSRGGGVSGTAFNSRAQGLYDPRDPKDRPRNRMRSTSDEGDVAEGAWTTAGVGKHGWSSHNKDGGQGNMWTGGQGGNSSAGEVADHSCRKSESGPMPEWMEDGEDQEREGSSDDTTSATGSFDEHGRFQKKHHLSVDSPQGRKAPDTTPSQPQPATNENHGNISSINSGERSGASMQASREPNPSGEADNSRGYSSIRPQGDAVGYHPSGVTQQPGAGPASLSTPPHMAHSSPPQFFYLDPTKQERGPFEKPQMDSWYKRGYFSEGLEVRRHTDTKYRTLGELMQLNGRMTPFDYKDDVVPHPPVTAVFSNPTQPFAALFAGGGMWSELGAPANLMYGQSGYDPIAAERKRIEDEQRRMLEEQAKMREYQEHLVRELQKQREEHEKQLMEQKMALLKHQEEIERRERELKESAEETKARLEMERLALAEKARQIEEERAAKIQEEIRRAEEKRAEEAERKRLEEELERQRKAEREELMRKQQEAERERRAKEAAEEEARRARAAAEAAAEKARLQQAELQRKQRVAEEANRKASQPSSERDKRQESAKAFEIEEAWQVAPKPPQNTDNGSGTTAAKKSGTTKVAPWLGAAAVVQTKEKSLKEIQEEEERQLRAEQAQQARLRKEQESVSLQSSGTWSNASQRLQWSQSAQQSPPTKTAAAKSAWGGGSAETQKAATSSPLWDSPPLQAANKVAANPAKKPAAEKSSKSTKNGSNTIANEKAAKRALGIGEDNNVFLDWVVQRLKQLNSTVEADVLAMFIEGVENPDEVEDYVVGYLGDSKAVKEFVREFLQKRSDFRNRKQHAVKDDLSSARGAPVSGNGAGGFSAVQSKKKKNKGARLVVDGSCLGFRATSDPNRVNQGEIETVALAPGQKR